MLWWFMWDFMVLWCDIDEPYGMYNILSKTQWPSTYTLIVIIVVYREGFLYNSVLLLEFIIFLNIR